MKTRRKVNFLLNKILRHCIDWITSLPEVQRRETCEQIGRIMQQIPNYIGGLLHVRQTESPFQVLFHQKRDNYFLKDRYYCFPVLLLGKSKLKKKVKRSCKTNSLNLELTKTQVPVHFDMVVHDLQCFIILKRKRKALKTEL